MKRAMLVTTGTAVGVAAVLAYTPNAQVLALIPGTGSPSSAGVVDTPTDVASALPAPVAADAEEADEEYGDSESPEDHSSEPASFTTGSSIDAATHPTAFLVADGTLTGSTQLVERHRRTYGSLVATATVSGGQLTALTFRQDPAGRNQQFIDAVKATLVPEILRTQDITVGIVTGATGTSMALIRSLQSALGTA